MSLISSIRREEFRFYEATGELLDEKMQPPLTGIEGDGEDKDK